MLMEPPGRGGLFIRNPCPGPRSGCAWCTRSYRQEKPRKSGLPDPAGVRPGDPETSRFVATRSLTFIRHQGHVIGMGSSLRTWEVRLGIVLVLLSVVIYAAKYLLLGDPEHLPVYL